jgi:RNA polymerase sigma-70 factor (ECF subfamily)
MPFDPTQPRPSQAPIVAPTGVAHPEDLLLVRTVLARDAFALDRLAMRWRCIPRFCVALNEELGGELLDTDLADLAQDVLVLAWRKLATFNGESSLETWCYGITRYEIRNALRAHRRRKRGTAPEIGLLARVADPRPERPWRFLEEDVIRDALESLTPDEADVVRSKHFDDLTFDEIGARLGISPNTAKTRYYRGLLRLQILIQEPPGEES